jgi:hypothetical protein
MVGDITEVQQKADQMAKDIAARKVGGCVEGVGFASSLECVVSGLHVHIGGGALVQPAWALTVAAAGCLHTLASPLLLLLLLLLLVPLPPSVSAPPPPPLTQARDDTGSAAAQRRIVAVLTPFFLTAALCLLLLVSVARRLVTTRALLRPSRRS